MRNKIQTIKDNVSFGDILKLYNIEIDNTRHCRCPIHRDKNPSLKLYADGHYHCFGCGNHGDVLDLFCKTEGITPKEGIDILMEKFRLKDINIKAKNYQPKVIQSIPSKKPPHFFNSQVAKYLKECQKNINKTSYFQRRGLTITTIKRFRLGYDCQRKAVTIPYNRQLSYYQQRWIWQKRFYKLPDNIAGSEPIFNESVLKYKDIVFIVESPICAMSIAQCGGECVPLCGVANVRKLLFYLKFHYFGGTLILCLDNDTAGENATKELIEGCPSKKLPGLNELKVNYIVENIADECKDPNELLMKNASRLATNVKKIVEKIRKN